MRAYQLIAATEVFVEPHLVVAKDGTVRALNSAALEQLEHGRSLVGRHLSDIATDSADKVSAYLKHCGRTRAAAVGMLTLRNNASKPVPYRCEGGVAALPAEEGPLILLRCRENRTAVGQFMTLNNRIEELNTHLRVQRLIKRQLESALAEKELLLRELHHRVKNNLQSITGLFHIELIKTSDERYKELLRDGIGRVQAIALVDRLLYEGSNTKVLNAEHLLKQLTENLIKGYATSHVRPRFDLDGITVEARVATSLTLIANEAIINCVKHAFPDQALGEILVSLKRRSDSKVELIIKDNGCGIASGREKSSGMGMTLMKALSRGFGELTLEAGNPGTTLRLSFSPDSA